MWQILAAATTRNRVSTRAFPNRSLGTRIVCAAWTDFRLPTSDLRPLSTPLSKRHALHHTRIIPLRAGLLSCVDAEGNDGDERGRSADGDGSADVAVGAQ